MNKKKSLMLLTILLVVLILTITCAKVFSEFNWNLNDTVRLYPSSQYGGDYGIYKNKDFYCIEADQHMASNAFNVTVKEILQINGDELTFSNNDGTNINGLNDEKAKLQNRVLSQIIKEAKEYEDDDTIRKRGDTSQGVLITDTYQRVMWYYLKTWADSTLPSSSKLKYNISSYSVSNENFLTEAQKVEAQNIINRITNEVRSGFSNELSENYYKEEDKLIEEFIEVTENGENYTILGPFQYKFSGELSEFNIYFDDNNEPYTNYKVLTYVGNELKESEIENEKNFYIKVLSSDLAGKTRLSFSIKLSEGLSSDNEVKIFYLSQNTWQNLIYVTQSDENEPAQLTDTYILKQEKEVELQKQDIDGNDLKVSGIEFKIYNITDEVTPIATLTTDANGLTQKIKLYTNTEYIIKETKNDNYGYKALNMKDKISITNGEILQSNQNSAKFIITDNATITIKNQKELANVEILKEGTDGDKLEGVQFIIENYARSNNPQRTYLRLYDTNDQFVDTVEGDIIINDNLTAISVDGETHYKVEYKHFYKTVTQNGEEKEVDKQYSELTSDEKSQLTKFVTDKDGKVSIHNLEINSGVNLTTGTVYKYYYTAYEVYNPNYGYGSGQNTSLSETATNLTLNQTTQIKITNTIDLGNLKLEKYDEDKHDVKLEDVGFAIEISPSPSKVHAYLALYDKDGNLVPSIKGTATINRQNIATDTEYRVSYYYTEKAISEMTDEEKTNLMENITTFITDDKGQLTVNNLEVYAQGGVKYTYKLIETTNSNYGYLTDSIELGDIILESNSTVEKELGNKQIYTKLSGYVWLENSSGKSNNYDCIFTDGDLSNDIKLTDLYINRDGQLIKNPEAQVPVEVRLRNKTTGQIIKSQPDEFDENGKYTFVDVEIEKLADYEVVFVYNGFYYTTVVEQLDQDNGSKVKEVASEREILNNKFATVKNNSEIVATDGTINTVEYYKEGHTSTVSKLNFDATLSANTTETNYNLKNVFDQAKANSTGLLEEIENINMGIVLREQPKMSINEDIYSVLVEFEGYNYNYKYNGRDKFYENKNGDDIGVKFEQENTEKRYTRTVYASDIQAAKDQNKEIKVSVTYKIQLANESRTLSVMPKQLINYFDARYDIKAVGLGLDETTHEITNNLTFSQAQVVEGHPEYKSTIIDFNQTIGVESPNIKTLYISFDIQREAILDLLNQKSTYHNAIEILSYTSYYGTETSMVDGRQFMTDQTEAGKLYAGIDKMSQPGNMEIVLVDHPSVDGTKILDTTNFEDDTSSAPSLLLEATESREVSGTIWEDLATNTTNNQKLGDGIYNDGEKPIQDVTVELHKLNQDGTVGEIATYSNGEPVSTKTNAEGNYTFGYYDEANNIYVGILPGKYVIEYTYDNASFIVGGKTIDPNEYKSTIIASQVVENAFNGQNERWYLIEEGNRYSDARDNIYLRPEYNPEIDTNLTVTNSTYNNILSIDSMEAHTPIMDIGIEFTQTDEADVLSLELLKELKNVDFGIIERPDIDITIEKEITGLEVITQTGSSIIPKGNPSNPGETMQYVKTGLEGLVSAEIESRLLQGAQLNLEYTITVVNNSDRDYLEEDYYYYGRNGQTEITSKVKKVVDYLDATMVLDTEQNDSTWTVITVNDLYNSETNEGLVSEEVYNELKSGDHSILTTETFEEVGTGSEKSVKLYATKVLATSDSIDEENRVEIIELTGKRTVKESIPGNYNPATNGPKEPDSDEVKFQVTPPTGTTVNYMLYIMSAVVTFAILVIGIAIIKKKIIK